MIRTVLAVPFYLLMALLALIGTTAMWFAAWVGALAIWIGGDE